MDAAGIGTGEEYGKDINSGTIEITGGKVWAEGMGYGAGIGAGEDATCGIISISGGRVDAHAGSSCGPWSGSIGAYHSHGASDVCHDGWYGYVHGSLHDSLHLLHCVEVEGGDCITTLNCLGEHFTGVHQSQFFVTCHKIK